LEAGLTASSVRARSAFRSSRLGVALKAAGEKGGGRPPPSDANAVRVSRTTRTGAEEGAGVGGAGCQLDRQTVTWTSTCVRSRKRRLGHDGRAWSPRVRCVRRCGASTEGLAAGNACKGIGGDKSASPSEVAGLALGSLRDGMWLPMNANKSNRFSPGGGKRNPNRGLEAAAAF